MTTAQLSYICFVLVFVAMTSAGPGISCGPSRNNSNKVYVFIAERTYLYVIPLVFVFTFDPVCVLRQTRIGAITGQSVVFVQLSL